MKKDEHGFDRYDRIFFEAKVDEKVKELLKKPIYFTCKQLAQRWDVHPVTISRWLREGKIPTAKHPNGRYTLKEVITMETRIY